MSTFGRVQFHRTRSAEIPLVAIDRNVVVAKGGKNSQGEVGKGVSVTETDMETRDVEANREEGRDVEGQYTGGDEQGFKVLRRLFRWLGL